MIKNRYYYLENINTKKELLNNIYGKKIKDINIENSTLKITFNDDITIKFLDDGQQCCEDRYMNCDDNLDYFKDATICDIEIRDGGSSGGDDDEYGNVCECQFLLITTNKGVVTIANYNEHNGYYSGFNLIISRIK